MDQLKIKKDPDKKYYVGIDLTDCIKDQTRQFITVCIISVDHYNISKIVLINQQLKNRNDPYYQQALEFLQKEYDKVLIEK